MKYDTCRNQRQWQSYRTVSEEYKKAVEKAKRKLRGLIAEKNCAPIMLRSLSLSLFTVVWFKVLSVRLVRFIDRTMMVVVDRWHSAGTFDVKTKSGGPFGTLKHPDELAHPANSGLDIVLGLLEPIKEQFPILSYADIYQVFLLLL